MRYSVVLLDAGETILRPAESFGAVYARVFGELGLHHPAERFDLAIRDAWNDMEREIPRGTDRYGFYAGGEDEYWLRFARRVLERMGSPSRDGLARRALSHLREAFLPASAWHVYGDVVPVLQSLRAEGVRLSVVSNWDSRLPEILRVLDLDRHFDDITVSHLAGVEKPDPALFRKALDRLGARPEQALHAGDLPELDLEGARAAGIAGVLVDRRGTLDPALDALPDLVALPRLARDGIPRTPGLRMP